MNIRENRGITLIMLIVTIITLLILAGVTISAITGGESAMNQGQRAKNETEIKAEIEELQKIINQSAAKGIRHGNYSGSADSKTIRDALKKNNLIVENPDDVIIDGESEWIVTGNKTNTQYAIQYNGEVVRLVDTGSIKVGDTVNYTPSGTYNWDAEYATSFDKDNLYYGYTNKFIDSSQDGFKITSWKVLNINKKTGEIQLVPSKQTSGILRLHGAQGYNNGVKLLNDACSALYGNSDKSITARSIAVEDFEKVSNALINAKKSYSTAYASYGNQLSSAYTWGKIYPKIYESEENCVINGNQKTNGLKLSQQTNLIERTVKNDLNEDVDNEKITATNSIQPYQTFYSADYDTITGLLGSTYSEILLPDEGNTNYWIATRIIGLTTNSCYFDISNIYSGTYGGLSLFGSSGGTNDFQLSLFPVVTLNYELLESTSNEGIYNVKRVNL